MFNAQNYKRLAMSNLLDNFAAYARMNLVHTEVYMLTGDPLKTITSMVNEHECDLLVVGHHDKGFIERK